MSGISRVIVGASGSPGSLQALRYAEELARVHDATLIPVLAWVPPGGDLADRQSPCGYLRRMWAEDATRRLRDTLGTVWGEVPAGLAVEPLVQRGDPGRVLVSNASSPGDLLVLGAGLRRTLAGLGPGKVTRYCVAHADCPVLAVPPPALARQLRHGLLSWAFWHRPLTPEQILRDRGKTPA
ncbi:MAG: universal stress protein [Actinobacteria bacterium]|nr:universal stress protein [Actinomycetota bacterium]MBO0817321.1 universal stress protein [Actinomycetota bacterium]